MEPLAFRLENNFIALGHSFASHQHGNNPPKWPILWTVPNQSIINEGDSIIIPNYLNNIVPGTELAVIIDKNLWQSSKQVAKNAIKGFTVANDVMSMGDFPGYPYTDQENPKGRGYHIFPTFSPIYSEYVDIPVENVMEENIETYIDGKKVVDEPLSKINWEVADLISHVSHILKLKEGDIISLGDPSEPNNYIDDADEVTSTITSIGSITNSIERKGENNNPIYQ